VGTIVQRSRNILISSPLFIYIYIYIHIYQRGAKWVVKHEGFCPGAALKRKGINGSSDFQIKLMIKENGLRDGDPTRWPRKCGLKIFLRCCPWYDAEG